MIAFNCSLKSRSVMTPALFFFKIALALRGLFMVPNFSIVCFISVKKKCIESVDFLELHGHLNNINSFNL